MNGNMGENSALFEAFNIKPEEISAREFQEHLLLRLSPQKYLKKSGSIWSEDGRQLMKLELSLNGRVNKVFSVYEQPSGEAYKLAERLYELVVTTHLRENDPTTVNQYTRRSAM